MVAADEPVTIEPLTKEESRERSAVVGKVQDDPEYPDDWKTKNIDDLLGKGFKYYRRRMGTKVYMVLRKGRHDKGLGTWSMEKERKLFAFHPNVKAASNINAPSIAQLATQQGRGFLSVPIARVAIIPRDYVPSLNVIRYFQILKEQGFPGDFSQFINDIVTEHFKRCHGIVLPVLLEQDVEVMRDGGTSNTN